MEYYRILLVDDEEEVRTSIMRRINWEENGFTLVGDAENGQDALEKTDLLCPDVVLTDIAMPFMDGLALTAELRRNYPLIKIVIFSGYDDFEYAQQAIKLNVMEYILKPVNMEELTEILLRIHSAMDAELQQQRNVQRLRESYVKSLPILREKLMQDLVRGCINDSAAAMRIRECGLDLLDAKCWVVLRLDIDIPNSDEELPLLKEPQLIPISVQQALAVRLRGYCRFNSFMSTHGLCAVAALSEVETLAGLVKLLKDVCNTCHRALGVDVTATLGGICTRLSDISVSYKQAKTAMGYKAILGTGTVISISDVEPRVISTAHPQMIAESDFGNTLKFGTEEDAVAMVQSLVAKSDSARGSRSHYQIYLLSLINALLQIMEKYELEVGDVFGADVDLFDVMAQISTSKELQRFLTDICMNIQRLLSGERENTTNSMVRDAQEYIRKNFTNPELSLDMVCDFLHISSTYFSSIFKKATGKSYIAYLTELRLAKAMELLRTTNEKTYQITSEVGYTEPNYFGYVFKKQFGISPAKYRAQNAE